MTKLLGYCPGLIALCFIFGCAASYNGAGVDTTTKAYFSPHYPSSDEVAVVYIYWNQTGVERYFRGFRTPSWITRVNGKTNATLELGSYSVVEVHPGTVRVNARRSLGGSFDNLSSRDPSLSLRADAGETYFVRAELVEGSTGLELRFQRVLDEREAYNNLHGTLYQENRQDSMLY